MSGLQWGPDVGTVVPLPPVEVSAEGWRFPVTRANGDGTETLIHPDVPLSSCTVTRSLSAPDSLEVKLRPERPDGVTFVPWSTCMYAEKDGVIRAGGILQDLDADDADLTLKFVGHAGYLSGQPWVDTPVSRYDVDPADMIRLIWAKVQSHVRANLGVQVDATKTAHKVGVKQAEVKDKTGNVTQAAVDEPFLLAAYETHDLGQVVADLLDEADLEYREQAWWDGQQPKHRIELGPRLGARLTVPFVVGTNVRTVPGVSSSALDYADEWLVLGAGEGPARILADRSNPAATSRLRRVRVLNRASVTRKDAADALALKLAKLTSSVGTDVEEVTVTDSPAAPVWAVQPGDEIYLQGDLGQGGTDVGVWVRVTAASCDTIATPDRVAFEVERIGMEETASDG